MSLQSDTSTLPGISQKFDSDVASAVLQFQNAFTSFAKSLISQIDSIPYDPSTATDVFDRVIPAFSLGIGDAKTGLYGDFVVNLNNAINSSSQQINVYVSSMSMSLTTQSSVDNLQSDITSLSNHISSVSTDASNKVSALVSDYSTKFNSSIAISQSKSTKFYVTSLTDSYIGAINRADSTLSSAISTLLGLFATYKSIPTGFYSDTNTILTELSTAYNDAINAANTKYNNAIAAYKYWSDDASSLISSSQNKIAAAISASNSKVSSLLDTVPAQAVIKSDFACASAIVTLGSNLFNQSIQVRNNLYNLITDLGKRAEMSIRSIDQYFKNAYVPIYVDGPDYRNTKSSLINGISTTVSNDLQSIVNDYNSKIAVINSNYSIFLESVQTFAIDRINTAIQGLTVDQVAAIESKLSASVSAENNRVSVYFNLYSSQLSNITDGVSTYLKKTIDKYFTRPPLLRFTGVITSPTFISNSDTRVDTKNTLDTSDDVVVNNNVFSFEVTNIGGIAWSGWFGIRLTSTVDYDSYAAAYLSSTGETFSGDYTVPEFKWNKRVGLESLLPGETRMFTVSIPGSKIYNLSELGSVVIPRVITNTYMGVSKLLLSN